MDWTTETEGVYNRSPGAKTQASSRVEGSGGVSVKAQRKMRIRPT